MYCPSCGTEYTIELKYCNRCGANLGGGLEPQPQMAPVSVTRPALIIGAVMTILTVFGFGMVIAGAVELSHNVRVDPDSSVAIVVVGMLTILTIDIFLARLLTKIITASLSSTGQVRPARNHVLGNPAMVQLPQPPTSRLQGVPSVTEGTTRFFETHRTPSEPQDRVPAERIEREIER